MLVLVSRCIAVAIVDNKCHNESMKGLLCCTFFMRQNISFKKKYPFTKTLEPQKGRTRKGILLPKKGPPKKQLTNPTPHKTKLALHHFFSAPKKTKQNIKLSLKKQKTPLFLPPKTPSQGRPLGTVSQSPRRGEELQDFFGGDLAGCGLFWFFFFGGGDLKSKSKTIFLYWGETNIK